MAYRGPSKEAVAEAYAQLDQASSETDNAEDAATPASIRPYKIDLQPADTRRELGANQYARRVFPEAAN